MDVDEIIQAAADSSLSRFPKTGDSIGQKLQRSFARQARDERASNAAERRGRGSMRIVESPGVVLPDGWDIHEFGRKET